MSRSAPWITLRDGEEAAPESMLDINYDRKLRPIGIRYRHELVRDRDGRGVLWTRVSQNLSLTGKRPLGRPEFASMHPARQRDAMEALRCQDCHGQPSRTTAGYLFLEMAAQRESEGMLTAQPPVCLEHAVRGIEECRRLLDKGYVLVRSKVPRLYGVVGTVYSVEENRLQALPPLLQGDGSDLPIPYTRRDLTPYVLASQLIRRLTGVTVVDIDAELEAAGSDRRVVRRSARVGCPAHAASGNAP